MTFKNNTHPKIQKWYHFASPKSDQIWSHSTCWNYSFKKLVTFEKKWKLSKFFLSLAAQNKSSFDIAFFLGKNKKQICEWFWTRREVRHGARKIAREMKQLEALFLLYLFFSHPNIEPLSSKAWTSLKLRSGTLKDAIEANYLLVWTCLEASMLLSCIWMLYNICSAL